MDTLSRLLSLYTIRTSLVFKRHYGTGPGGYRRAAHLRSVPD
jgi:hypothetical protein